MKIKRVKPKTLLKIGLIIVVIFAIRYYQQQDLISDTPPILKANTITGEIINSNSIDKPIMVHFWATWCKVCHYENNNIQELSKDYKVLNIAISSGSDEDIIKYANDNNMKLDNIINDSSGAIANIFGVNVTPSSFFIKNNKIRFIEVGYTTELGMRLRMWIMQLFY